MESFTDKYVFPKYKHNDLYVLPFGEIHMVENKREKHKFGNLQKVPTKFSLSQYLALE